MNTITVTEKLDITDLMKQIKENEATELVINFDRTSDLFMNSTNLKVIKDIADGLGKTVKFDVDDEKYKDYIEAVNNDTLEINDSQVDLNEEINQKSKEPVAVKQETTAGEKPKRKIKGIYKILIAVLFFIVFAVGLLWALLWYLPSAVVNIKVNSEVLVKLLDVNAVAGQETVSVETATIPAYTLEVEEKDSLTKDTTGEKVIGEKAKGKIKVTNKTDKEIKIKEGTVVKLVTTDDDKENLKFIVASEVKVPAKKEETETTPDGEETKVTYGVAKIDVEAATFGKQYNLDKGEKFKIDDYDIDDVVGENEEKIKGGSSETVKVVTQEDLDNIEKELEEVLKESVNSALRRKVVSGQTLLEQSVKYEVASKTFDKELDEEADTLTLEMTMKGTGLAYSKTDLDQLVSEMIKTVIPEEYQLDDEKPEYEVAVVGTSEDGNSLQLQVKLRSYITPTLDIDKIKNDLAGLSLSSAESYLNSIKNIDSFEIRLFPNMPAPLQKMPRNENNIKVTVENQ